MKKTDKAIRDPVHDIIPFSERSTFDMILLELINSKEFQRLRRISQLGLASMVYPGSEHSRFTHSIGAMHTAKLMLAHLQKHTDSSINDDDFELVCLSALLHDTGHGPFSHAFEKITNENHETRTIAIISGDTEINKILRRHNEDTPKKITELLLEKEDKSYLGHIVSSQLDCDRFDYLRRDSIMTGTTYGLFDLGWMIHTLACDIEKNRLIINQKGLSVAEDYLYARFHMYRNVYFHKTIRSAEVMLRTALSRAKELTEERRLSISTFQEPLSALFKGESLSLENYLLLDEITLWQCFREWSGDSDPILSKLCKGLIERKLLKAVDFTHIEDMEKILKFYEDANKIVRNKGFEPKYFCIMDEPKDTPYTPYDPDEDEPKTSIYVDTPTGQKEISQYSEAVRALADKYRFRRLHVPIETRNDIARLI